MYQFIDTVVLPAKKFECLVICDHLLVSVIEDQVYLCSIWNGRTVYLAFGSIIICMPEVLCLDCQFELFIDSFGIV